MEVDRYLRVPRVIRDSVGSLDIVVFTGCGMAMEDLFCGKYFQLHTIFCVYEAGSGLILPKKTEHRLSSPRRVLLLNEVSLCCTNILLKEAVHTSPALFQEVTLQSVNEEISIHQDAAAGYLTLQSRELWCRKAPCSR